jgi:hypothetical protein
MRSAYLHRQAALRQPRNKFARAVGVAGLVSTTSLAMFLTGFLPTERGPISQAHAAQARAADDNAVSLAQALARRRGASSPVPGADYGHSVYVDGTTAVVGAPEAFNGQGTVFIFSKVGTYWKPTAELNDPNRRHDGDFFGYSVAMSGSTIAVGAPEQDKRRGEVYVFHKFGARWYLQSELPCPGRRGHVEMNFGLSLAIAGKTLLIGSPGWNNSTGLAYIYRKSPTQWYHRTTLALRGGILGDNFGYSVAIAGGTILIGTPGRDYASGRAYVFGRHGRTAWRMTSTIVDPGKTHSNDGFGYSVSLAANTAIISAPGRSGSRGAAYIYSHRGRSGWHKIADFTDPHPVPGDNFGSAVSITRGAAVIGASFKNDHRGDVYILNYYPNKRHRYAWHQTVKYYDPSRAAGDFFGSSVSVSDGIAVVGAVGTDNSAGAVYVFARSRGTLKTRGAAVAASASSILASGSFGAVGSMPALHTPARWWRLKFNPSFAGTHLNTKIWKTCFPWTRPGKGCSNYGNLQYQWFMASQVHVDHGLLSMVAHHEPVEGQNVNKMPERYDCRSGMVTTNPGFNFTYGVVQVVAKMSGKTGMWPALWLAASNRKWPPEIDMVEHWFVHHDPTVLVIHPLHGRRAAAWPFTLNLGIGWHTYTLVWTPTSVTFFVDGQVWLTTHMNIPHQRMYFEADLADQYNPKYGGCIGSLALRSVKIWQLTKAASN